MLIQLPDGVQSQAIAAGFANVDEYITALLDRDAERVAIREGLEALRQGRVRPFEEFDAEFRRRNGLAFEA
jgi:hypothetical protein